MTIRETGRGRTGWFIKYRVTCPAEVYGLAQQYIEQFVVDFPILPSS